MLQNSWDAFPIVGAAPTAPVAPASPALRPGRPNLPTPPNPSSERRAERGEDRQDRNQVNDLFNRFNSAQEVQQFRQARIATQSIRSLAQNGMRSAQDARGADDVALIFSFMRALDPNSTVREGEFATAQNTAGIPERIRNYYNSAQQGTLLGPQQRADMVNTAYRLYLERARSYNEVANTYREQARYLGAPDDRIGQMFPIATGPQTEDARRQSPQGSSTIRVLSRRPAQ